MTETKKEREKRIQSSHQFQNGTFVNPNRVAAKLFSLETWEVTKEYIFGKRTEVIRKSKSSVSFDDDIPF